MNVWCMCNTSTWLCCTVHPLTVEVGACSWVKMGPEQAGKLLNAGEAAKVDRVLCVFAGGLPSPAPDNCF